MEICAGRSRERERKTYTHTVNGDKTQQRGTNNLQKIIISTLERENTDWLANDITKAEQK